MAIYAISDLHLALSVDKPMDIFGAGWEGYLGKLKKAWEDTVTEDDYVVIPGDISWATYLEEAIEDFKFIESLPGKKIISKGNHDYWWTTMKKLKSFLEENGLRTISFLHNNCYIIENTYYCGTRGWNCPGDEDFDADDMKIYRRELLRLELSLKGIRHNKDANIIAALHFPPFNSKKQPSEFVSVMRKYNVKTCIYGHLHGDALRYALEGKIDGIEFRLVSADHLNFKPLAIQTP